MKFRLFLFLSLLVFLVGRTPVCAQAPAPDKSDIDLTGYTKTFEDNFDTLSVTTDSPKAGSTWYYWPPYGAAGAYSESAWDIAALSVNNGILSDKAFLDTSNKWHSGNLSSIDPTGAGFTQQYGYFEIRCKMPSSGTGAWPAFWLMTSNVPTNTSSKHEEVDIFEWYGTCFTNKASTIQEASHQWNHDGSQASGGIYSPSTPLPGGFFPWEDYHTYGCQVDPVHITWYVDGKQTNQCATPTAYLNDPFYIMIDYAVGGGWPTTGMVDKSEFLVDWVRAYSLPPFPQVTSSSSAIGTVGSAFSYQIAATNTPTSYKATDLPEGLSLDATTGAISGKPTASGSKSVTISATNAHGTGTATLNLSIGGPLTSPWTSQDIGSVGAAGSASSLGTGFTVVGSGADVWGTADAFQYVSQPVSGANQTIIAHVTQAALAGSDGKQGPDSKAGIMFRDSSAAGAKDVYLVFDHSLSLQFMSRSDTDGGAGQQGPVAATVPVWLKLVKTGDSFSGFSSSDGTTWTQIGAAQTVSFTGTSYLAGLISCAGDNTSTATSIFDSVSVK